MTENDIHVSDENFISGNNLRKSVKKIIRYKKFKNLKNAREN